MCLMCYSYEFIDVDKSTNADRTRSVSICLFKNATRPNGGLCLPLRWRCFDEVAVLPPRHVRGQLSQEQSLNDDMEYVRCHGLLYIRNDMYALAIYLTTIIRPIRNNKIRILNK